ncbi:hypothetical protein OPQ81_008877 [Rhizoctonia solani]|nr:hypothetical protein OPQ81_008877 [Rhizoctonia solani]
MIVVKAFALVKRRAVTRTPSSSSRTAQLSGKFALVYLIISNPSIYMNLVIGANQAEGVHCKGSCNIYNVWFEDVCEDTITLRQTSGITNIVGSGTRDKFVQHNGGSIANIDSYRVQDFGKLYRACGNCKTQYKRYC